MAPAAALAPRTVPPACEDAPPGPPGFTAPAYAIAGLRPLVKSISGRQLFDEYPQTKPAIDNAETAVPVRSWGTAMRVAAAVVDTAEH